MKSNYKISLLHIFIIIQLLPIEVQLASLNTSTLDNNASNDTIFVDLILSEKVSKSTEDLNRTTSRVNNIPPTPVMNQQRSYFMIPRNFSTLYSFKLYKTTSDVLSLNKTVEKFCKLALMKYFNRKSSELDLSLIENDFKPTLSRFIRFSHMKISLESDFNISASAVSKAFIEFSLNKNKCFIRKTVDLSDINCNSSVAKDADSLLNFYDFWIQIDNSTKLLKRHYDRMGIIVDSNNHEWSAYDRHLNMIISLAMIACLLGITIFIFLIVYICSTKNFYRDRVYPFRQDLHSNSEAHIVTTARDSIDPVQYNFPPKKPRRAYY